MSTTVVAKYKLLFEDLASKGLLGAANNAQKLQSSLTSVGKGMTKTITAPLLGFGAMAIKTAGNFESAMNGVRAVSGATGKDFELLRDTAKELGASTAFSATEAANGMEYLAMAGMNTEQVIATIPHALNLAAAGNLDLATSADILSNIMSGMGLTAEESGRAADVLAATAAGANTDIEALGEAMKYVAPIAKTMGYSFEETSAAIGILGNAGIASGQAGTSLRAIMTRIASDKGANETLKELGVATTDANGEMRSLTDILSDLHTKTKGLSSDSQIEIFKDIAGAEAMGALSVLVDGVANDSLPQLIDKLNEADGAVNAMADIKMEGFDGAVKRLSSAFESFMISIGETGALDMVTGAIEKLAGWVKALGEANPSLLKFGVVIGVILAVIGPLLIGIGMLISAVTAIGGAMALVSLPVLGIVAAIAAVIAIGVALYANWDTIKAKATEIWGGIKDYVSTKVEELKSSVIAKFEALRAGAVAKWEALKQSASAAFEAIRAMIVGRIMAMANAARNGLNVLVQVFSTVKSRILAAFGAAGTMLVQIGRNIVQGLVRGITSSISAVTNAARNLASKVSGAVKGFLGIRSPSRLMASYGGYVSEGMAIGISNKSKLAVAQAKRMADNVASAAGEVGADLASTMGRDATIAAEAKSNLNMTHRFAFDFSGKVDGANMQVNTTYTSNGSNAGSNMPVML